MKTITHRYQIDLKLFNFAINLNFINEHWNLSLNLLRIFYIKHAELYFHEYQKHDQDLV